MPKDTKKKSGFLKGAGGFTGSSAIYDLLLNQGDGIATIGKALLGLKDGGRVPYMMGGLASLADIYD